MEIGPLVKQSLVTVGPDHSVAEAAGRMSHSGVGSAVVLTDDGHPGIITERDVLRAVASGADLAAASVADWMTANAITATASWSVVEAARRMSEGGFRHLIVLDDDGKPYGILSIRDLMKVLLQDR
jgi:CBS domain-containing protein